MDKYRLEYEIKSRGYTIADFCNGIGINRSSYYRKTSPNSSAEFTLSEIQKAVDFLGLESPMGIFFEKKVS